MILLIIFKNSEGGFLSSYHILYRMVSRVCFQQVSNKAQQPRAGDHPTVAIHIGI
jgi:hypothetical protein